jgi:hypothetical protein
LNYIESLDKFVIVLNGVHSNLYRVRSWWTPNFELEYVWIFENIFLNGVHSNLFKVRSWWTPNFEIEYVWSFENRFYPTSEKRVFKFSSIVVLAFLSKNGVVLYENVYSIEEIYAVLAFLSKNGVVLYENIYSMEEIEDKYF